MKSEWDSLRAAPIRGDRSRPPAEKLKKGYEEEEEEEGGGDGGSDGSDSDGSEADANGPGDEVLGATEGAPLSRFHTLAKGVLVQPILTVAEGACAPRCCCCRASRATRISSRLLSAAPASLPAVRMLSLEAAIRAKPDWARKALDERVAAAWKADFMAAAAAAVPAAAGEGAAAATSAELRGARPEEADWVLAHAAWLARGCDGAAMPGGALPSVVRGAVEARGLVTPPERAALIAAAAPLEAAEPRDYHPGSRRRVINLVHPSLCECSCGWGVGGVGCRGSPWGPTYLAPVVVCMAFVASSHGVLPWPPQGP